MAKFRPLRRSGDADVQRDELVRHAEQVDRVLPMHGQLIDVEWPFYPAEGEGGSDSWPNRLVVPHSLGRAYRGGFIAGATGLTDIDTPVFMFVHPDQAVIDGVDVTRDFVVVVNLSTLARSERVRVWIF